MPRMKTPNFLPLVVLALVSGCSTAPPKTSASVPKSEHVAAEAIVEKAAPIALPAAFTRKGVTVKVEGVVQRDDGTLLSIRGSAKNVTASDLKSSGSALSFYDGSGQSVDNVKATTKSLKSGQIWHFQVAPSGALRADIRSIEPERVVAIPLKTEEAALVANKP